VAVASIKKPLVTSVGVSGSHGTLDNTKFLIKDFDEGGKAVSGARSIADDGFIWTVSISIDTNHVGWDVSFARG
ncbi:hypothetical protein ABE50_00050, partial [Bacillus wiedmannii]|nr:hypothetical protein [Bacillus wiedmannii]